MKLINLKNNQALLCCVIVAGVLFFVLIIINLNLSFYELEENSEKVKYRMSLLHTFFNQYSNISFPIAYSLKFYQEYNDMPIIYIITPTDNKRPTQMADLIRMRNTLWLVPKIVWILIEDSEHKTNKIGRFLNYSQIPNVHLNDLTPEDAIIGSGEKKWSKPRGVVQRNKGLDWLRSNSDKLHEAGVVYFADDDNTYDIRLFEEMRYTKKVSVWPVAFVGEILYERPICKNNKVVDWFVSWGTSRPFPVDMAGFAVNLKLLMAHPSARFSLQSPRGMQESHLLNNLVRVKDLECKAENSTKIYVWHTNTRKVILASEKLMGKKNLHYDLSILEQF